MGLSLEVMKLVVLGLTCGCSLLGWGARPLAGLELAAVLKV